MEANADAVYAKAVAIAMAATTVFVVEALGESFLQIRCRLCQLWQCGVDGGGCCCDDRQWLCCFVLYVSEMLSVLVMSVVCAVNGVGGVDDE